MQRIAIIFLIAIFVTPNKADAWRGDKYEKDPPHNVYEESDLEDAREAAIDDNFSHCVKITGTTERLSCYDRAMVDLGYKVNSENKD